eukprot:g9830.t1
MKWPQASVSDQGGPPPPRCALPCSASRRDRREPEGRREDPMGCGGKGKVRPVAVQKPQLKVIPQTVPPRGIPARGTVATARPGYRPARPVAAHGTLKTWSQQGAWSSGKAQATAKGASKGPGKAFGAGKGGSVFGVSAKGGVFNAKGKIKGKGKGKTLKGAPPANSEYWQIKMASENREVLADVNRGRAGQELRLMGALRAPGLCRALRRLGALASLLPLALAQDQIGPLVDFSKEFPERLNEELVMNVIAGDFVLEAELGLETNFEDIDRVLRGTLGQICQHSQFFNAPVTVERFLDMESLVLRRKAFRNFAATT